MSDVIPETAGANVSPDTFGTRSEGRKNNFDFLRFFLATAVIYHHSFDLLLGHIKPGGEFETFQPDTLAQLNGHQFDLGWLSVNCFFIISGFLITSSWLHGKGLADYVKKRVLRIYPGYAAALLFSMFIIAPLSVASLSAYFHNNATYHYLYALALRKRTDLPGVFPNVPLAGLDNGSLWTILYEARCYALVAGLGVCALLRFRGLVVGLFLGCCCLYVAKSYGLTIRFGGDVDRMPRLTTYFLAGMAFYLYRDRLPYSKTWFALSLAGIVGSLLLHIPLIILPLLLPYALFYIAFNTNLKLENFARHGDYSYGTYLYAFPIQQLLIQYAGRWLNPYILFLLSWPLTVMVAAASWYLIEKPFLKLKGKTKAIPIETGAEAAIMVRQN